MTAINYAVGDDWGSGFIGNMTVGGGTQGLHGWTIEFDAGFDISNIWGATIVSHVGNHYVVSNADWNANVAANGQATFGFQATPGSTGSGASAFTLNGVPDTSTPPPPPPVLPTLSIADSSITEGDSGTANMTFTVKLSQAATGPVTVNYSTADGTATAGSDYTAKTGTLTFAAGETSKTITIPVIGDTVVEANETFSVKLAGASGATIATAAATGTIIDNDVAPPPPLPTLSIADSSITEGNSGTSNMAFTVKLSQAATGPVTVNYSTADGTATAGSDYTAKTGTLSFAAGETSKTITVAVMGDTVVEANETFAVKLAGASGAIIATAQATGTIVNDDVAPLPTLSIADSSIAEGNSGTSNMTFTVKLSQAAAGPVTVNYSTADGTATAGSDYAAKTGTLTFAAGETSKTITVAVTGDTVVEANETFAVKLAGASGATIATGQATGTIVNDDVAAPPAGGTSVNYHVDSDWGTGFTATMGVGAGSSALNGWTVEFDAAFTITNIWNATIVSHVGNHYMVSNASWNGQVGASQATSFGFQATETSAGNTAAGFKINGTAVGTAPPPPPLPTLSVADASVTEGNSGTHQLAFAVSLSAAATAPVTVAYATSDGTATAGSDYTATHGTVTFAAGETSKVVNVSVLGDTVVEANETLNLTLSTPSGATLAHGSAVGTIINDDTAPLPTLSIGDASFAEGSAAAPGEGNFTVSLSAASTTPVTVDFATADGTAIAGSDYTATHGTVTFAAGETSKIIHVDAIGDSTVEPDETFHVTLSNAGGATIAHATGNGTIVNDDTAAPPVLPTLSISDASVVEGNPGQGSSGGGSGAGAMLPSGALSTSGNQIVDSSGTPVQISGVNWFGFETTLGVPHGLYAQSYESMMDQMKSLGFNTIRLPFSTDMLHSTQTSFNIDYSKNPDLQGLTSLQIMDKIVDYADQVGLKIILDHHRSGAGDGAPDNGLWYDSTHSQAQWISDWQMLAQRYAHDPSVTGADLQNEPYNGNWGGGGPNDWVAASESAGNAIGAVNPNWLIFVEGVANYQGQSYWWGGNLMGVKDDPVVLNTANKLVYSAHDYPDSVYAQPWFQGSQFPADLTAKFDQMWGYIYKDNIAPVYIGEFGTGLTDPKDTPWLQALTAYLGGDTNNDGTHDIPAGQYGPSWTYWSWNPDSGDTGGIVGNDWKTVNQAKMAYLSPVEYNPGSTAGGGTSTGPHAVFHLTLSAPATQAITVDYHTVPGTADASDFTMASGTVTFAVGQQTATISIAVTPDTVAEGNEQFSVVLDNVHGATLADATGVGTIVDDDTASTQPVTPTTPTTPAPTDPTHTTGSIDTHLQTTDSWIGGFNGSVDVHNNGSAATGWEVTIQTHDQITSIWNAAILSHDADGYVIGAASWNTTIAAGADTSFGFTASGPDDPTAIQVHGVGPNDVPDTVPTVPTALVSSAVSATSATLGWQASSVTDGGFVTGYAVYENGHQVATTTSTAYHVTGLTADTDYHFSVAAIDGAGQSAQTSAIDVHTTDPLPTGGAGHMFSPYIDMAMSQDDNLSAISQASGIENFTLAFMLSSPQGIGWQGNGTIDQDTLANGSTILQQVQDVQAAGGHITISFGGAAGTEAAATATSATQLQGEYQSVIDRYGIDSIDFDIEGAAVQDTHSLSLRDQALVGLEAANPGLKVSFTLPVLPTGLTADGLNVLKMAQHDGVKIDMVNIMTMDYGQSVDNNGQMGQDAIQATQATEQQLASIGMNAKIGITPMIGVNDVASEVFTLSDAQALVDYAKTDPQVAQVSMWSVARDNGNSAGAHFASSDSSGVAQTSYEYAGILHHYDSVV